MCNITQDRVALWSPKSVAAATDRNRVKGHKWPNLPPVSVRQSVWSNPTMDLSPWAQPLPDRRRVGLGWTAGLTNCSSDLLLTIRGVQS